MTEEEIVAYLKRKLGGGIETVELTVDHFTDIMNDTKRWFLFRVGQKQFMQLTVASGISEYTLPANVLEVLSCRIENYNFDTAGADDFSYAYGFVFGSWYTNTQYGSLPGDGASTLSPMPYSDLVQRLQYLETIQRVWGGDPEWFFDKNTKKFTLSPAVGYNGIALMEIFSNTVDTRQLDPEPEDFFLRWALAEAKETLGTVRSKYDSYPTVGGDRSMNGDQLLSEAREAKEKLEIQVLNRIRSTPIVSG